VTPEPRSPRLARWLLRRTLAGPARSAIAGDLEEEFTAFVVPRHGIRKARRWYWRQTVLSIAACARGAATSDHVPDETPHETMRAVMFNRDGLGADLRAGMRLGLRSPWTSFAVVFTLAIGIAANTAVFSLFNAAVLKKLPIAHADRLVAINATEGGSFSYPEYRLSKDAAGLSAVIAGGRTSMLFGDGIATRRVIVEMISANYFEALGVEATLRGRLLTTADDAPGDSVAAVLSARFWRTHLNADDTIIGKSVRLQQGFVTIAGVAPANFSGTQAGFSPDLWIPLAHAPGIEGNPTMLGHEAAWLGLLGVLERPDSLGTARDALTGRWHAAGRTDTPELRSIPRGHRAYLDPHDNQLLVLAIFVGLILAVACLNVATLLGASIHDRAKELAIRATLGAGRFRLLRQLLVEHLLLASIAAPLGGLLGVWGAWGLAPLIGDRFTPGDLDVSPDRHVALFVGVLAIVIGVSVALLPALRWSRTNLAIDLQVTRSGMPSMRRTGSLWWLIPSQVALGTMLLASAGALVKTVSALQNEVAMLAPERVWFADLDSPGAPTAPRVLDLFHQSLLRHLRAMPGAEVVGLTTGRPLASTRRGRLRVEGMTHIPDSRPLPWGAPPPPPPPAPSGKRVKGANPLDKLWIVSNTYVTPGFFSALTLPIVRGRDFTPDDGPTARRVAIVNETLARRALGEADPIGRKVAWGPDGTFDIQIIGVVRDYRSEDLRHEPPDSIFFPLAQIPATETVDQTTTGNIMPMDVTIALRASSGQRLNAGEIVQRVQTFDNRMFVDRVRTFADEASRTLSHERLLAWSGSLLGAIALVLLIVGLYATLAAAVVRSRRELGIRLALGARTRTLQMMVIRRGLLAVIVGLAVGVPLAYAFTRWIAHLLYGVRAAEPTIVVLIAGVFLAATLLGTWLPASRAARVDPLTALRAE
jgi:putative ABC transport system permease protein